MPLKSPLSWVALNGVKTRVADFATRRGHWSLCVHFYRLDVWPSCDVSQRPVLLPAASTPLCPSVARHRIYYNTDPCICLEPRGLLLQSAHRVTAFSLRQASARPQCITNTQRSMKAGYHRYCITTFTGWMLQSGFSSEWLQQFISVCTAWLQRTWLNCVRLSLRQQAALAVFGPSQPATWSYHAADCQPTAPVRSVLLVQSAGMPYRII